MMKIELKERINRLKTLHLQARSAFILNEKMKGYRAPNLLGIELARKHSEDLGAYKGFINIAEKAINTELHITLAKLFDNHNLALHIDVLVRLAKEGQQDLGDAEISDEEVDELYRGLTQDEWAEMDLLIEAQRSQIERLKRIRNTEVAHIDLVTPVDNEYLTYQEMSDLIDLSGEILNRLSIKFLGVGMWDEMYFEEVTRDTERLLELISLSEDESKAQRQAALDTI
ncbi:MAG: hypothetical protein V4678_03325 [Patescibacteria group bacterium]